jgi:hypothetical protein
MKTLLAAAALALIALTTEALAHQRTIYGSDGKAVARCTSGSTQTTCFGADGKVVSRESTSRSGSTTPYGADGNVLGKTSRETR